MNLRRFTAQLAIFWMASSASLAWAQDDAPSEASDEATSESTDSDAAEGEDTAAEGDAEAALDGEPTTGEGAPAAEGQVLGPGGRPLRTDYPGTEESLKATMETDKIQGLNVDPNEPAAAYGLRIRELETKIDDLKEKVFQSKTRIVLLRETVLSGNLAGARAVIIHKTELGSAWRLQQAYYALDGTKLFNRTDKDGDLSEKRSFEVYNGSLPPGTHNLSILVKYGGTNVGIFPYFKGYDGDIKRACEFKAQEGKIAQLKVRVVPEGGIAESIEQRPTVQCTVEYLENIAQDGAPAPTSEEKT